MLTVSRLAKKFKISRTTILYYEKEGLLMPASRSDNGYRWYGNHEILLLESIINYRSFGISIPEIRILLEKTIDNKQQNILRQQFNHLEQEIKKLRLQQQAIVNFLETSELSGSDTGHNNIDDNTNNNLNYMTKEKWTEIMRSSGMDDEDMHNWHREFEKLQPDAHQEFLESLQIDSDEINQIRQWSGARD